MRLRSREFEGQFDPGQSLLVFSWPRHSEYTIDSAGNIKGEGYDGDAYLPLEDSDLFLSFIRLGAQAQPSDKSILRWSEGYGLLRRDDESVTVFDFQEEVRCARQLATLYTDIRQGDSAAIWARYMGEGEHRESQHHTNPIDKYFATFQ